MTPAFTFPDYFPDGRIKECLSRDVNACRLFLFQNPELARPSLRVLLGVQEIWAESLLEILENETESLSDDEITKATSIIDGILHLASIAQEIYEFAKESDEEASVFSSPLEEIIRCFSP